MARYVFLHVTKACNLRCDYCYFSASRPLPGEMTAAELGRVWPDMVKVRPQKVVFTGGEPLPRADIFELLAGLRDADPGHQVRRCLNSNGHLVTADVASALAGLATRSGSGDLARQDPQVAPLTRPGACMGGVYAATRQQPCGGTTCRSQRQPRAGRRPACAVRKGSADDVPAAVAHVKEPEDTK